VDEFWSGYSFHDTITIYERGVIRKIEKAIEKFKLVKRRSIIYLTFSVQNVTIRFSNNIPFDTIYSDQFFQYWKKGDRIYRDRNETIRKNTGGLLPRKIYPLSIFR
jgi:hypothetical protein